MNTPEFDADALITAMLPLLGIELGPDARKIVKIHLDIATVHAAKLLEFPLDDVQEPASVFTP